MHKVFICYHHDNDQDYKEALQWLSESHSIFIDMSVDTGDIDESLDDEAIREKIRDEYLKDSTVTIVLVGIETKKRKHVDWEIYSSMYDGKVNKKSGVLVINLPSTRCTDIIAAHGDDEKRIVYPEYSSWTSIGTRAELERQYSCLPARIIDNLVKNDAKVSVTYWDKISNRPDILGFLIEVTHNDRTICKYDLSRPMRRRND